MRACFKKPYVILKMYEEFDSTKLTDGHFILLDRLEKDHQADIASALELNSLAVPIYKLACCHRDNYNNAKAMQAEAPRYPDLCAKLIHTRTKKFFLEYIYSGATNPWSR